jgi:hypothetical protein
MLAFLQGPARLLHQRLHGRAVEGLFHAQLASPDCQIIQFKDAPSGGFFFARQLAESDRFTQPDQQARTALGGEENSVPFNNSSRSRPLKLSMKAFCMGLARPDVIPFEVGLVRPGQDGVTGRFAAIVAEEILAIRWENQIVGSREVAHALQGVKLLQGASIKTSFLSQLSIIRFCSRC